MKHHIRIVYTYICTLHIKHVFLHTHISYAYMNMICICKMTYRWCTSINFKFFTVSLNPDFPSEIGDSEGLHCSLHAAGTGHGSVASNLSRCAQWGRTRLDRSKELILIGDALTKTSWRPLFKRLFLFLQARKSIFKFQTHIWYVCIYIYINRDTLPETNSKSTEKTFCGGNHGSFRPGIHPLKGKENGFLFEVSIFLVPLGNEELGGGFRDFVIYLTPDRFEWSNLTCASERHWATHQVEEGFETF